MVEEHRHEEGDRGTGEWTHGGDVDLSSKDRGTSPDRPFAVARPCASRSVLRESRCARRHVLQNGSVGARHTVRLHILRGLIYAYQETYPSGLHICTRVRVKESANEHVDSGRTQYYEILCFAHWLGNHPRLRLVDLPATG